MAEDKKKTEQSIAKVISLLIKEDKKKLFEMIKKLNARQQYASMAQVLLRELLPRFEASELMEEFKQSGGGLKSILEATEMYSDKHYTRADRNLKRTFYVQYVLSQMTLLEDKNMGKAKFDSAKAADSDPTTTMGDSKIRKRDKKAKAKKDAKVKKTAGSKSKESANLFTA